MLEPALFDCTDVHTHVRSRYRPRCGPQQAALGGARSCAQINNQIDETERARDGQADEDARTASRFAAAHSELREGSTINTEKAWPSTWHSVFFLYVSAMPRRVRVSVSLSLALSLPSLSLCVSPHHAQLRTSQKLRMVKQSLGRALCAWTKHLTVRAYD